MRYGRLLIVIVVFVVPVFIALEHYRFYIRYPPSTDGHTQKNLLTAAKVVNMALFNGYPVPERIDSHFETSHNKSISDIHDAHGGSRSLFYRFPRTLPVQTIRNIKQLEDIMDVSIEDESTTRALVKVHWKNGEGLEFLGTDYYMLFVPKGNQWVMTHYSNNKGQLDRVP